MNWSLVGFLAINFVFSTTGDILAKVWGVTGDIRWFYTVLALGVFTSITFMLVVRSGGLSVGSTVALLLTMIANITVGVFFFNEALMVSQWFGIALGLVAAILILRPI